MKNPEGQLPRYVEDRQAFDSVLRHRKGQIYDGWSNCEGDRQRGYEKSEEQE